ncbi:GNAT family N-acetyltransferase [Gordonia malaquae]|uniref:GNAT family N-acetyltransferase n=1 Tax=Gordonia malaquae TaxID=410332 RepID=UPI00301ADAC9
MTTTIRAARPDDADVVLGLFDDAIAWLAAAGLSGQWGSVPWSEQSASADRVRREFATDGAWIAERPGLGVCGGMVLGSAMPYVQASTVSETYVRVLVGSRVDGARGVGRELLAAAERHAREAGSRRLRLDCYAGGSGALVDFYRSCGYVLVETLDLEGWPAAVLVRDL